MKSAKLVHFLRFCINLVTLSSVAETRMKNLTQIVFHRKRKTRRFYVILRLDFHASEQKKICTDFENLVVFSFIFVKYHVKKRLF